MDSSIGDMECQCKNKMNRAILILSAVKKYLCLIFVVFFIQGLCWAQDGPKGFRGIRWGTDISECPYLKPVWPSSGDSGPYIDPKDSNSIGDIVVTSIYYLFCRGKFCGFEFEFVGEDNLKRIMDVLIEKYGQPSRLDKNLNNHFWFLKRVSITLRFADVIHKGRVIYSYTPAKMKLKDEL